MTVTNPTGEGETAMVDVRAVRLTDESSVVRTLDTTPWADPTVPGLFAFALSAFLLSWINAGWVSATATPMVLGVFLFYTVVTQVICGILALRKGSTLGALILFSFAGFWGSLYYLLAFEATKIPAAQLGHAVALFLCGWAIFVVIGWVATLKATVALNLIFLELVPVLGFLAAGYADPSKTLLHIGGYFGLLLAATGFYAGAAPLLNSLFGRTILPDPLMPTAR
jgi:succinate-acetate transporter protein